MFDADGFCVEKAVCGDFNGIMIGIIFTYRAVSLERTQHPGHESVSQYIEPCRATSDCVVLYHLCLMFGDFTLSQLKNDRS